MLLSSSIKTAENTGIELNKYTSLGLSKKYGQPYFFTKTLT